MRPELFAVRAINQYRRRDVLAYLGLRYYLENHCARSDFWAKEVSTHLVNTRASPGYFRSYHFKEVAGDGSLVHRNIRVPGPNELIAEASLLHECSLDRAFVSLPCVYSYRFPKPRSKEGVFRSYFPGFRDRHDSIAEACKESDEATVRYTDIRKFYPKIRMELALDAWRSACDSSEISPTSQELGERLLVDQAKIAKAHNEGLGILTGPMFSHLIANLVLAGVDTAMYEYMGGRYWRYVDDIVLVGDVHQVDDGRKHLGSILDDMGFLLHDKGKDFAVESSVWLEGAGDFNESDSRAWISLIANIKRFLLAKPEERPILARAFLNNGINIPLLDYSNAVAESSYIERLYDWLSRCSWAPRAVRALTVKKLVQDAIQARGIYQSRMKALLDRNPEIRGYERKRLIPKLRFYAGRLIFLAPPDTLSSISSALLRYPELLLRSRVMSVIQSRDVSPILGLGSNAVQAAAQILRISGSPVRCSLRAFEEVELQGLAILRLNGIDIDFADDVVDETIVDPLNQFALGNAPAELMKSDDPFIREVACLRGIDEPARHRSILDTAFDRDEQLVLDVINQLQESSYF